MSELAQEIHETNLKIKHKIPVIFIYILVLVIIFQAGIVGGVFISVKYTQKQIKDAITAEAFVFDELKNGKFSDKKVMYKIEKYEVTEVIPESTLQQLQKPKPNQ